MPIRIHSGGSIHDCRVALPKIMKEVRRGQGPRDFITQREMEVVATQIIRWFPHLVVSGSNVWH